MQHVKQVSGKEVITIRKCNQNDKNRLISYLNEKPVFHTFLLSDIQQYGFDKDFQTVYAEERNGSITGVFLRYFSNLILAGDPDQIDFEQLALLAGEEVTTVMGDMNLVKGLADHIRRQVRLICNNLYIHETASDQVPVDGVTFATVDDVDRIHEFLMTFPEFKKLYSEKGMIVNRISHKEGVHVFIEHEGRIVAHANSAASADHTCMLGGICVAEDMRHRGYAKKLVRVLCGYVHKQNKIPCVFAQSEQNYQVFEELGFRIYGKWGVAQI